MGAILTVLERLDEGALLGSGENTPWKSHRPGALKGDEAYTLLVEGPLGLPLTETLQKLTESSLHLSPADQLIGTEVPR